jgi:N6-adenosine-specific RNA methylase IME4
MLLAALSRRHLTPSQKAALAVELAEHESRREKAGRRSQKNLLPALEPATLPARGERPRDAAARLAGVSARTIQDAQTVKDNDRELFERLKAGLVPAHRAAKEIRRGEREARLRTAPPLPRGLYEVIYADPPWRSPSPGSEWAPEQHYPTMETEEIKALPVPVAADALLFLWVPNALLPGGLEVLEAWGLTYRTNLVWVKPSIGIGFWLRNRHELLLLGRKGDYPLPEEAERPDSVIEAARRRHSQKPEQAYVLIERMCPGATKLELFARGRPRAGWEAWGNEVVAA